jgi:hypothetical protein
MLFEPQAQKFLVEIFRLLPRFHTLDVGCEPPANPDKIVHAQVAADVK